MPISGVRPVRTQFEFDYDPGLLKWHELADALALDEERNQLIVDAVLAQWSDGRVVIVVTKTHEHVELLHTLFTERGVTDVNRLTGRTNPDKIYTRALIRNTNERQCRLILSTLQAVSKGANIRALDSLHIVMPPAGVDILEQLLGRLRRKFDANKTTAEVTWYLDEKVPYLRNLFFRKAVPLFTRMKVPGYENGYSYIDL